MVYTLCVQCLQETGMIRVNQQMSFTKIIECIGNRFNISTDSFEFEVYHPILQKYIDFDGEYAEEFQHQTRTRKNRKIHGRVLLEDTKCTVFTVDDTLSSLPLIVNSPGGMSVEEELRSTTSDIDLNLCIHDEASMLIDDDDRIPSYITFVRDVAPFQRSLHPMPVARKKNFTIRIQGVKTESDPKYLSILPEIKFPLDFTQQKHIKLVVAVVREETTKNSIEWRLTTNKGFLYDDAETDKMPYNPICLDIDQSEWTEDGIYKLPLRMCTIAGSQIDKAGSVFRTLNSRFAKKLHPADHLPNTPRLACVISDESGNIYWNTFGLSDFMRPKCYQKRKLEETNPMTNDLNSPPKRICSIQSETTALPDSNYSKNPEPVTEPCQTTKFHPAFNRSEMFINSFNHSYQQEITDSFSSHRNIKQTYEDHFLLMRNISSSPMMNLELRKRLWFFSQCNQTMELNFAQYHLENSRNNHFASLATNNFVQNFNCFPVVHLYMQDLFFYTALNEASRKLDMNTLVETDYLMRDTCNRFNRNNPKLLHEFLNRFIQCKKRYRQ